MSTLHVLQRTSCQKPSGLYFSLPCPLPCAAPPGRAGMGTISFQQPLTGSGHNPHARKKMGYQASGAFASEGKGGTPVQGQWDGHGTEWKSTIQGINKTNTVASDGRGAAHLSQVYP